MTATALLMPIRNNAETASMKFVQGRALIRARVRLCFGRLIRLFGAKAAYGGWRLEAQLKRALDGSQKAYSAKQGACGLPTKRGVCAVTENTNHHAPSSPRVTPASHALRH
jgi:hypothetical protein